MNEPNGTADAQKDLPIPALQAAKNAIVGAMNIGDQAGSLQLQGVDVQSSQQVFGQMAQAFALIAIAESLEKLAAKA